ncbi:hypothetical protein CASFOL_036776 [Castilleja foliolosa]|uniref:Uncharacterized protein n=1 Tax=Castilleja foliolosa TaxID=1961234 RepID=A0ABD3BNX8_9LAMI
MTHIECHERLEPTPEELVDYSWWSHMADDVRSSVTYFHRKSTFTAAHKVSRAAIVVDSSTIRPTRESLLHPSTSAPRVSHANPEQSPQQHSRECGSLPQKRARTMDSFDVHAHDYLLTQISDLVDVLGRENALFMERVKRENALFMERVKQEITLFMERVKREKALLMERPNQENGLLTERLKQESGLLMERLKQEHDLFTERLKHENALLMERLKREIEEQMRGSEAKDRSRG